MSLQAAPVTNQRAGAGDRRGTSVQRPAIAIRRSRQPTTWHGASVQRSGTGAARLCGDRRGASVQRSGNGAARRVCAATGAARLCSGRRPPLGGRTRLVITIIYCHEVVTSEVLNADGRSM